MNSHTHSQTFLEYQPSLQLIEWFKQQSVILLVWQQRARTRIALSKLDRHLLEDIGISAKAADVEANKPFWKG